MSYFQHVNQVFSLLLRHFDKYSQRVRPCRIFLDPMSKSIAGLWSCRTSRENANYAYIYIYYIYINYWSRRISRQMAWHGMQTLHKQTNDIQNTAECCSEIRQITLTENGWCLIMGRTQIPSILVIFTITIQKCVSQNFHFDNLCYRNENWYIDPQKLVTAYLTPLLAGGFRIPPQVFRVPCQTAGDRELKLS